MMSPALIADVSGPAELARAREAAYGFLASALVVEPGGSGWSAVAEAERLRAAVGPLDPARVEEMIAWLLAEEDPLRALTGGFEALLGIRSARHLLPYESVYAGASWDGASWRLGRLRGPQWHMVLAAYRRRGFEPADASIEADHLAVELGFLGRLCEEEAAAWDRASDGEALAVRHATRAFLEAHPAAWVTRLRQRADDLTEHTWFLGVVHLVECMILEDQRHLTRDGPG